MNNRQRVFQKLDELNISYSVTEHPAAVTVEQMEMLEIPNKDTVVKNLFLRDFKGVRHFLIVIEQNKKADLKKLQEQIGSTRLSFASEERLLKYMGLTKGSVSPFGVLNDPKNAVEVVFDRDLAQKEILGVHPNDNTATVFISFEDLKKVIEQNGSSISYADI